MRQMVGGARRQMRYGLLAALAATGVTATAQPARAASPEQRAAELVAKMTPDERFDLVGSGTTGLPRLGIPPLIFTDGPNGVGNGAKGVTAFPTAVNIGASWDPTLALRFGAAVGQEARAKGKTLIGAPTLNIVRTPKWGRAAETLSEDPFLTGALAAPEVKGIQSARVISQVKHFAANNQEVGRFGIPLVLTPGVDVRVSQRALHEIYFPGFKAAIQQGGAASVMCSYNQINGKQVCQDPLTLGALKGFGLRGFVEPDATAAVRDIVAASNAGVDNFQLGSVPGALSGGSASVVAGAYSGGAFERDFLKKAVAAGTVSQARIDQAARSILTGMVRVGLVDAPAPVAKAVATSAANRALATKISAQASVLLQNRVVRGAPSARQSRVLPLSAKDRSVAVIGYDAGKGTVTAEGGSPAVRPGAPVITPLAGIRGRAPKGTQITYAAGTRGVVELPVVPAGVLKPSSGTGPGLFGTFYAGNTRKFTGDPVTTRVDPTLDFIGNPRSPLTPLPGTSAGSARWTGTLTPPKTGEYRFSLTIAGAATLRIDGKTVVDGDSEFVNGGDDPKGGTAEGSNPGAPDVSFHGSISLTAGKSVPITVEYANQSSIEGSELHLGWQPPEPSLRAQAVAAARKADTAVVFVNDVTAEGMDRTSLSLPGDQDDLIAAVAKVNPRTVVVLHTASATLMPWRSKVAAIVEAWYPGQQSGAAIAETLFGDTDPSGRLPVTFPASESQGPTASSKKYPGIDNVARYDEGVFVGYRFYDRNRQRPLFPFGFGLSYTSFSLNGLKVSKGGGGSYSATVRVSNTGRRAGAQVVQLYVGAPANAGEPPRQLKAFGKVFLKPAATKTVRLELAASSFQTYNETSKAFKKAPGRYRIMVGTSSRDLPLTTSIEVR